MPTRHESTLSSAKCQTGESRDVEVAVGAGRPATASSRRSASVRRSGASDQSLPPSSPPVPRQSLEGLESRSVADVATSAHLNFRQTCFVRECHGKSIFGLAFNSDNRIRSSDPLLFATTAGHHVTIYQCLCNEETSTDTGAVPGSASIILLQSFADPAGDGEEFYTCAWSRDTNSLHSQSRPASSWWLECSETGAPRPTAHQHQQTTSCLVFGPEPCLQSFQQLLAVAGRRGIIRILCPSLASCPASLVGHGQAVNELKFHPLNPALLFSFSKDYTIHLWNISTRVLLCIFGGAEGHRSEVLHGDVSLSGDLLLSVGMDHTIKIWQLNTPELEKATVESFSARTEPFPTVLQHFPDYSTRDAHGNYVDCARWFGGLIVSKSCENCIVIWRPGSLDSPLKGEDGSLHLGGVHLPKRLSAVGGDQPATMTGVPTEHGCSLLHQLRAPDCNLWYIRFDLDIKERLLAVGTGTGPLRIYVWDLAHPESAFTLSPKVLNVSITGVREAGTGTFGAIRQTRFANNGKTLLAVGDNGLVVRFDRE